MGDNMAYKRNKDDYFRKTYITNEVLPSGKKKRVVIRDKDLNAFKKKVKEADRLYNLGVTLDDATVAEWGEKWLAVYKSNASPRQKKHYKAKVELDIVPAIGNMLMRNVLPSDLQKLLNTYEGGKLGTVKKIRTTIKQFFADAQYEGIIERNPAARLEIPKITEESRRPLTSFERAIVYNVGLSHKDGPYFMTMLFCGLRRGEDVALTVGDVSFESYRIRIYKAMNLEKNTGVLKGPKSEAGVREVAIPDRLIPFLRKQCDGRADDSPLFPKEDGKAATASACKRRWGSFLRKCHLAAGAPTYRNKLLTVAHSDNGAIIFKSPFDDAITPHYLRHTYATDLYAAGVDEKAQKYFLGHASADVTDRYRKMSDAAFARARQQLNEYYATLNFDLPTIEKFELPVEMKKKP